MVQLIKPYQSVIVQLETFAIWRDWQLAELKSVVLDGFVELTKWELTRGGVSFDISFGSDKVDIRVLEHFFYLLPIGHQESPAFRARFEQREWAVDEAKNGGDQLGFQGDMVTVDVFEWQVHVTAGLETSAYHFISRPLFNISTCN